MKKYNLIALALLFLALAGCIPVSIEPTLTLMQVPTKTQTVLPTQTAASTAATIDRATVLGSWHLRTCAGYDCPVAGYANDGDEIIVVDIVGNWYQLDSGLFIHSKSVGNGR